MTAGVSASSGAVLLTLKYNIDITFPDKFDVPCPWIWHPDFGSVNLIGEQLVEFDENQRKPKSAVDRPACESPQRNCGQNLHKKMVTAKSAQ